MIAGPRAASSCSFVGRVIKPVWKTLTKANLPSPLWQHHTRHHQNASQASPPAPRAQSSMQLLPPAAPHPGKQAPACSDPHTVDSDFLHRELKAAEGSCTTCMLLLNFQLPKATAKLWHQASFKLCADGGSNRLFDSLPSMLGVSEAEAEALRPQYLPQAIIGDLDSIRPDVRQFYLSHGVAVLDQSADQDTTDLMKCLNHLERSVLNAGTRGAAAAEPQPQACEPGSEQEPAPLPEHLIIVLGALGGRLDHALSNLNTLYQYPRLNIVLWGDGNLVRLLKPGTTRIRPHRGSEGPACGLVPLGGPAIVSSSGLRWDLDNTLMQISGLISTCNVMEADDIWVTTDRELLWMTEVKEEE